MNAKNIKEMAAEATKQQREERRESKAEVTIIRKDTGEIVNRSVKYYDEAERWANSQISGLEHELKYKIYKMM
jgi:uncharacterized membrane protein YcaP (DUF421 family)